MDAQKAYRGAVVDYFDGKTVSAAIITRVVSGSAVNLVVFPDMQPAVQIANITNSGAQRWDWSAET